MGAHSGLDGAIVVANGISDIHAVVGAKMPVVNISTILEQAGCPSVITDNLAIGRMAAEHLLAHGYTNFAYHREGTLAFSKSRCQGFVTRLAQQGYSCDVFDTSEEHGTDRSAVQMRAATALWLRGLPKPVGVFTHNDTRASVLLDICAEVGLSVPQEIGVVGNDNDELISLASSPRLSSVDNAADTVGYRAAELLVRLVRGETPPSEPILIQPRRVEARESTFLAGHGQQDFAAAIRFIRSNFALEIGVNDVLEVVPISRRSLERLFHEKLARSPGSEIRRLRIELAKRLLAETNRSMLEIGIECGYAQYRNFATAFRREVGITPSEYRRDFGRH
jgi:LacI family transcriptional regulator